MKTKPSKSKSAHALKITNILVPTDFSRNAAQALRYAVPLARQVGAKITLLHVLDWPVVPTVVSEIVADQAKVTGAAKQSLDQLARTNVPAGLLEKTLVRVGSAHRDIVEAARGLRMDLIVISTQGRTGLKRALLGSTAERVVRHASCPVLTVRGVAATKPPGLKSASLAPRINRILVPVDFSAGTNAAVQFATGLARAMGARLALLHVIEPLPIGNSRHRAEFRKYLAETKVDARKKLAALAAFVPEGIKVEVLLHQDIPHQGVVTVAGRWRSDLIVLPTRGLTGVKYIMLGSTAEAVVRHAPCPVLTLGGAAKK